MAMHVGQVDLSVDAVAAMVAREFPDWRGLPIGPVRSGGTVNALFRIGGDFVVRFPLVPSTLTATRAALHAEQSVVRRLADHLPVAVPEPLGVGQPGPEYAGFWTAYRWIPGDMASVGRPTEHSQLAIDLARIVEALWGVGVGTRRWDGAGRGGPLAFALIRYGERSHRVAIWSTWRQSPPFGSVA